MRPVLKIVAPTDFSAMSMQALDTAVTLAKTFGARLHLLHAVRNVALASTDVAAGLDREAMRSHLEAEAEARLAALAPRLHGADHGEAVRTGPPGSAILEYANEIGADLIVIATHGRRGLARFFVGSTAEHVLRRAACPVVTVRPRPEQPMSTEEAPGARHAVHDEHCGCVRDTVDFRTVVASRGAPLRVRDAMRRDVITVGPETAVRDVVDLIIHHDLPGISVVDDQQRLLGYIPEGHLLRRSLAQLANNGGMKGEARTVDDLIEHQRQVYGETARELMRPVETITTVMESDPLSEAVLNMLADAVPRMPVLRSERLVGYLTRADVLRVMRNLVRDEGRALDDEQVGRLVRQALEASLDVAVRDLRIEVSHGSVSLRGTVTTATEITHTTDIVRRVPGVRSVSNMLLVEQMLK